MPHRRPNAPPLELSLRRAREQLPTLPQALPGRPTLPVAPDVLPVECPECHGAGQVNYETDEGTTTQSCPCCDGAGTVTATTAMTWLAGMR
jgi:hypothetical protein